MQLMLGVVASAIGAALAVAYIGLKGNSHAGWNKQANAGYDKFIKHTATAIALSIFAVTDRSVRQWKDIPRVLADINAYTLPNFAAEF